MRALGIDARLRPVLRPYGPVGPDPIVRPAREAPIADRGIERDRLAVENEHPVRGAQRRHHFLSAAAGALVNGRRVFDRHVKFSAQFLDGFPSVSAR